MASFNYKSEAEELQKIIDCAVESFKLSPPPGFSAFNIENALDVYQELREFATKNELEYGDRSSLLQARFDALTYFQESHGRTVAYFWNLVKERGINVKRENRLKELLKRGKINARHEYEFIVDVLQPYIDDSMITDEEVEKINGMISDFASADK